MRRSKQRGGELDGLGLSSTLGRLELTLLVRSPLPYGASIRAQTCPSCSSGWTATGWPALGTHRAQLPSAEAATPEGQPRREQEERRRLALLGPQEQPLRETGPVVAMLEARLQRMCTFWVPWSSFGSVEDGWAAEILEAEGPTIQAPTTQPDLVELTLPSTPSTHDDPEKETTLSSVERHIYSSVQHARDKPRDCYPETG